MIDITQLKINLILLLVLFLRYFHLEYKQRKQYTDKRRQHINSLSLIIAVYFAYVLIKLSYLE